MQIEMSLIIVGGAICLAFLNIDKIQRFKGAGFEAEMKKTVEDAIATIEQLRNVATTSSRATLTSLMAANFMSGTTMKNRLELHDQLISNLANIGASKQQIEEADEMWKRGVGVIYHRGIKKTLEGRNSQNELNIVASRELQALLNFDEWKAPSSIEIENFIFISGQGTYAPKTGQKYLGDISQQTRLAMDNLKRVVESSGLKM
ncbi:MAG: hypothetical protein HY279_13895, partial [Nitrospinae bacterium]|nr:hypothetical protein [Nitrospinota bacterium]